MNNEISYVILKPDALGAYSDSKMVADMYIAFADYLANEGFDDIQEKSVAERAAKQAMERSRSECSFQGSIRDKHEAIEKLRSYARTIMGDKMLTSQAITRGIELLGFKIQVDMKYQLHASDVDGIYRLLIANQTDVKRRLHEYLDNQAVRILKLQSYGQGFLLQHWKTFVRHFLIINRLEQYPIQNLIHVADSESEYIDLLISI